MMKKLGILCCGIVVVGLTAMNSDARPQYRSAIMEQIDAPSLKDTKAAMEKLGTSSKQCAHCHGKKKSERTPFGDKVAKFLLDKEYVTKDPVKPNEYVYVKEKWTKDENSGKYPQEALDVLKAAIEAASKK